MASRRAGGAAAALLLQSRRAAAMAVGRHASGAAGAPAAAGAAAPDFPGPVRAALVRGLPSSFAGGLKMQEPGQAIDMALAARQHGAYEALLRELVPRVIPIPADDAHPDCVFIEDTAVVTPSGVAIVSRPGAPSRQGEVGPVAAELRRLVLEGGDAGGGCGCRGSGGGHGPLVRSVHVIQPPAVLDGGDVLQICGHLVVGLSARTNAAAAQQIAAVLAAEGDPSVVVALPVPAGLHLKSACCALDHETLLVAEDAAGAAIEEGLRSTLPALAARLRFERVPDPLAANVLRVGRAVVAQGTEPALAELRALCDARGLELRVLPRMTEFAKADGALTCCSILLA